MVQIALLMNNMLSDNSKSHQSVTVKNFAFLGGFSPLSSPFMARQSMSLMDAFENDNEALTTHLVHKQIDYDYSIN